MSTPYQQKKKKKNDRSVGSPKDVDGHNMRLFYNQPRDNSSDKHDLVFISLYYYCT